MLMQLFRHPISVTVFGLNISIAKKRVIMYLAFSFFFFKATVASNMVTNPLTRIYFQKHKKPMHFRISKSTSSSFEWLLNIITHNLFCDEKIFLETSCSYLFKYEGRNDEELKGRAEGGSDGTNQLKDV